MTLTERVKALESRQKLDSEYNALRIDNLRRDIHELDENLTLAMESLNDRTMRYIKSLSECIYGHKYRFEIDPGPECSFVIATCSRCGYKKTEWFHGRKHRALKRLRKHMESLK